MYSGSSQASFSYNLTPWVKRLLIANVAVFLVTMVDLRFFFEWFAFSPSTVLTRPWGVVTYMFLHGGLMHLFVNMLVLFFFGPPLEARWGSTDFLRFYLICGLGGVALSFVFAPSASIVGASAAIYGLMLAFALTWPEAPIYIWGIFPVKAKWLVGFLFVVSLMSAFGSSGDNIAHFAHLGGIVTGFFYLRSNWRPGGASSAKRPGGVRVRRMAIVPREDSSGKTATEQAPPESWSTKDEAMLDEVDRILDKISAQGMTSLTSKERETLDHVSKKHRSN
ncbi:MAG: rhomboid family intramembrane serine protease [Gemmatimonadetes bacterium]|nr:rhomboid family intramembrane serine protease [Gemmatimonadota bacterium]NNM04623.1 rhomboid family intramembrane serine protease [Gemmatimonadota bacterium]